MNEINGITEIRYAERQPEKYIMEMLSMGVCGAFLPASFIHDGNVIIGSFDCSGFTRLDAVNTLSAPDIFSIIIGVLHRVKESEENYIFPDEYEIGFNTIFINKDFSEIKFIFRPADGETTGQEKIVRLIEILRDKGSDDSISYFDDAVVYIKTGSSGYRAIIHHMEKLRREIYMCGIQ